MNKDFRNLFYIFVPAALSGLYVLCCMFASSFPDEKTMENVYRPLEAFGGLATAITLVVVIWSSRQQSKQWREQMKSEEERWSQQLSKLNEQIELQNKSRLEDEKITRTTEYLNLCFELIREIILTHQNLIEIRNSAWQVESTENKCLDDLGSKVEIFLFKHLTLQSNMQILFNDSTVNELVSKIGSIFSKLYSDLDRATRDIHPINIINFEYTNENGYPSIITSVINLLKKEFLRLMS